MCSSINDDYHPFYQQLTVAKGMSGCLARNFSLDESWSRVCLMADQMVKFNISKKDSFQIIKNYFIFIILNQSAG